MATEVNAKNINTLPDGRYLIESGLYLVVRRGGLSRQYVLRYSFDGRRRDLSLGSPSIKRLTVARAEALKYRQMIAEHVDPLQLRQEQRAEAARRSETLDEYFESFYEAYTSSRSYLAPDTPKALRTKYRLYVSPIIGKRLIEEVDVDDVRRVLDPIWQTRPSIAKRVRSAMDMIFNYARRDGKLERPNPAVWRGNLDAYYPSIGKIHVPVHQPAPSLEELRRVMTEGLGELDRTTCQAFYAVALCASRLGEVAGLSWEEVDFRNGVLLVSPERRKDRKQEAFRIPITRQCEVILKLARGRRTTDYVFESPRRPWRGCPIDRSAVLNFFVKSMKYDYTVHGIRSTFRDWAAEKGVPDLVAEKCLMHAYGGAVFHAYQRSDLLEQRREVLQMWADTLISVDALAEAVSALPRDSFGDVKYR